MAMVGKEHLKKRLAIVVAGRVIAAPILLTPIADVARMTGSFSRADVERIAGEINQK